MDIKTRIESAKLKLRNAENAKITAETQKKTAEDNLKDVVVKMSEHGVTPETIDVEIANLEKSINEDLESIERLIPEV